MKKMILMLILTSSITLTKYPTTKSKINKNQRVVVYDKEFAVSICNADIIKRIKSIAQQISRDYAGKNPIFVGVLNGAFIFLSDLVKELDTDLKCEIDFIKISSYGDATTSSGKIVLQKDLSCCVTDRDVVIVEDIIDSGLSIKFVKELIEKSNPRSIRIATLLDKNLAKLDFPIDYIGFKILPEFVIGYGLDYAQAARNLKDIYKLVE